MGFFKRRKEQAAAAREHEELIKELSKPLCQQKGSKGHFYRDFPPYIIWNFDGDNPYIKIKEPYVCCYCHERVDKILQSYSWNHHVKWDQFDKALEQIKKEYKDIIKPIAVVEDMVNDAIMVDRQKLNIWDNLHTAMPQKQETEEERLARYSVELLGRENK